SATFAINQYSVFATAGAYGSLDAATSSPQTVNHGITAQFKFNAGTGYHVAGVTGCGVSYSNSSNAISSYTATTGAITGECTVSATFAINQYSVSATAGANGSLDAATPSPQTVNHGATTQFKFNAGTGYHVAGISGCGVSYSNSSNTVSSYTATTGAIAGNCTISATFAINQYSVSATAGANGSLDAATPSPQTVNHGATTQFTFSANTGYHVAGVTSCGVSYTNTSNVVSSYTATTGAITGDCTVSATFAINQYSVTATAGANGSLDAGTPSPQTVNHGSTTQFTFNANTGYHVAGVTGCGVSYSNSSNTVASYTATTGAITGDCMMSATFAVNRYMISSSSYAHGSISPLGAIMVNHGGSQAFAITPDTGYHVADVLVDDISAGAVLSYQFTNVIADHSIVARFAIDSAHLLSVALEGHGTGSVTSAPGAINCPGTCSGEYDHGATVTLTAEPGTDSAFGGWSGDCAGKEQVCTVTVDQARSVTARFNGAFPWPMFLPTIINNK
ncbi:MAG: InlB B-repeat-containing protein, partial [Desulfobulbaceae bacterium]